MKSNLNINEVKKYISQRTKEIMRECMQRNGIDKRCTKVQKLCLEGLNNTTDEGNYNYFAVSKATGKIINGWDYNGYDPEELKSFKKDYFTDDLVDYGFDPKKVKILTLRGLKRAGIDPDDDSNWSNGDDCLAENKLRGSIKKIIKEEIDEIANGTEAIDFDEFNKVLERNGWSYSDSYDVENSQGQTGVRYIVNADTNESVSFEELVEAIKAASSDPDAIIPSKGRHRYAPEIENCSIIVLNQ